MTERVTVRALVVDDEELARRRLVGLLAAESRIVVIGEAGSGGAAVEAIARDRPDLVFLDVQMPGLDGFGVLRSVARNHLPAIIFVTAHDEHAIQAFEVDAIDYLLKPVTAARLHRAVERAIDRIGELPSSRADAIAALLAKLEPAGPDEPRIALRDGARVTFVKPADVDWIEASGDHLRWHLGREARLVRGTMAELETELPNPPFVRIHRSVVVNASRVREVVPVAKGDYRLILLDGTVVRSGRSYRGVVKALIGRIR